VLDRIAEGASMEAAIVEAQEQGFAESDVARDISGKDTEDKLRILARIALGAEQDGIRIRREGLEALTPKDFELAKTRGQVIRLVATIDADGRAEVAPVALPATDFLAGTNREENRLVISGAGGAYLASQRQGCRSMADRRGGHCRYVGHSCGSDKIKAGGAMRGTSSDFANSAITADGLHSSAAEGIGVISAAGQGVDSEFDKKVKRCCPCARFLSL